VNGFSRTDDFADIKRGFDRARFYPCIHCWTGKYFLTHLLLEENPNPRKNKMNELISSSRCRCTNYSRYAEGIIFAAQYRRKRYSA
jgi:aerobic-type carbon monoxide dehydrogenase small subunit (CoxS/CutS family)